MVLENMKMIHSFRLLNLKNKLS